MICPPAPEQRDILSAAQTLDLHVQLDDPRVADARLLDQLRPFSLVVPGFQDRKRSVADVDGHSAYSWGFNVSDDFVCS